MLLAPVLGAPPRVIAERLGAELRRLLGDDLERLEVAGPGFLNLFLSDEWHRRSLAACSPRASGSAPAAPSRRSGS